MQFCPVCRLKAGIALASSGSRMATSVKTAASVCSVFAMAGLRSTLELCMSCPPCSAGCPSGTISGRVTLTAINKKACHDRGSPDRPHATLEESTSARRSAHVLRQPERDHGERDQDDQPHDVGGDERQHALEDGREAHVLDDALDH